MTVSLTVASPTGGVGTVAASGTISWSHTAAAGDTDLIVCWALDQATGTAPVPTCTYNGVSLGTAVATTSIATSAYVYIWHLAAPPTGSALTVQISYTAGSGGVDMVWGCAMSFTGGSGSVGTGYINSSASGAMSVAVTSTTSGGLIVALQNNGEGTTGSTSPNTTQFLDNYLGTSGNDGGNACASTDASTGGAVTPAWTYTSGTSHSFAACAVEVLPAGGAPAGSPTRPPFLLPDPPKLAPIGPLALAQMALGRIFPQYPASAPAMGLALTGTARAWVDPGTFATLTQAVALTGTAAANSAGFGSLSETLTGTGAATSSAQGTLQLSASGTASAISGANAALTMSLTATAWAQSSGNATITIGGAVALVGTAWATSASYATLSLATALAGTAAAYSGSYATLSLALSATAPSTSAGYASLTEQLTATAWSTTTANGTLTLALSATGWATSADYGTLVGGNILALSGTAAANSASYGTLTIALAVGGTGSATSGAYATLSLAIAVTGRADVLSGSYGTLGVGGAIALVGTAAVASGAAAVLIISVPVFVFTPPVLYDDPPIAYWDRKIEDGRVTAEWSIQQANPKGFRLMSFYKSRPVGVNIYKMSDGTYHADRPVPGLTLGAVPYPNIPIDQQVNEAISITYSGYQPGQIVSEQVQDPTVVTTYVGGTSYEVSQAEAADLTAAGLGAYVT